MTDWPDLPSFDPKGIELVYAQVADYIQSLIESGYLRPGQRLPPERDLAADFGVAYISVRRASKELRERGLIRTVYGKGNFVERR